MYCIEPTSNLKSTFCCRTRSVDRVPLPPIVCLALLDNDDSFTSKPVKDRIKIKTFWLLSDWANGAYKYSRVTKTLYQIISLCECCVMNSACNCVDTIYNWFDG